jgi:hypothetical protein
MAFVMARRISSSKLLAVGYTGEGIGSGPVAHVLQVGLEVVDLLGRIVELALQQFVVLFHFPGRR